MILKLSSLLHVIISNIKTRQSFLRKFCFLIYSINLTPHADLQACGLLFNINKGFPSQCHMSATKEKNVVYHFWCKEFSRGLPISWWVIVNKVILFIILLIVKTTSVASSSTVATTETSSSTLTLALEIVLIIVVVLSILRILKNKAVIYEVNL